MKAVIIGGVAAGMSAASKLRRVLPEAEITVYERGSFLSYGACGLPYYIGGVNDDYSLMIARTKEQFDGMRIKTYLRHEALSVDAGNKRVKIKNHDTGEVFTDNYDKLMIATGCDSVMPDVPGADNPGVFYLKSMEDGLLLQRIVRLPGVGGVVVIGGGFIGVEMAEAMLNLGKKVTLIERADRILTPFEPEFSEMAARELERNGAAVRVKESVLTIEEKGDRRVVRTDRGEYAADIVLMSVGISPATEFLRGTGIALAKNGAVIVDREMRTSLPDVFAAGDCAVVYNKITEENFFLPLGTVANKCGRIAGGNMAGMRDKYVGALGTSAVKVCGIEMGRTGMSETDAKRLNIDYKTSMVVTNTHPAYYPGQKKLTIKLIYESRTRRLLGACAAGAEGAVMRVDMFAIAIHCSMTTDALGMVDLAYAPPFSGVWDAVHIAANAAK